MRSASEEFRSRRVVMWKSELLGSSETFVRFQFESISPEWRKVLMGLSRVDSGLARDSDLVLYGDSQVERLRARLVHRTGRGARLLRSLRTLRPDVIHAQFANEGWIIAHSARRLNIPLVVTLHGSDVTQDLTGLGVRPLIRRWRLRTVFAQASALIAVSSAIADQAMALGAPVEKVHILHVGVQERVRGPVMRNGQQPVPRILFVGRFVEKKGILDLLAALSELRKSGVHFLAVLVGDGPLRSKAEQKAARDHLPVVFRGELENAAVLEEMRRADVLAVPSRTASSGDSEGLPTTAVEAASVGLPVVGTRHSGIPEIVHDEVNGLLVDEGDVKGLEKCLRRLLTDGNLRCRLSEGGLKIWAREFDIVTQTRALEELYSRVCREH